MRARRGVRPADDRPARRRLGAATGRLMLARAIGVVTLVVVAIIVIGIALVLLKANPGNAIVSGIRDAAKYLSRPLDAIFTFDRRRTEIAVNWGIAALVYLVAGRLLSRLAAR